MKLGAQLYSVRNDLKTNEQIERTFQRLKEIGYENVQLSGHTQPEDAGFFREVADKYDLPIISTHTGYSYIVNNTEEVIARHKIMNCPVIGIGAMDKSFRGSLEGYRAFCKSLETPVKKIHEAGLAFSYHNHDFEWAPLSDSNEVLFDRMLDEHPDWRFLMDTYWVDHAGQDVLAYMDKIGSERLVDVHYKDSTPITKKICACGNGTLDFVAITKKAEELGVVNILVEQDNAPKAPDAFGEMQRSFITLRRLIK